MKDRLFSTEILNRIKFYKILKNIELVKQMTRSNNPDKQRTSINVKRTTRDKLNKLKEIPEEHLDSVIVRLIKEYVEVKE